MTFRVASVAAGALFAAGASLMSVGASASPAFHVPSTAIGAEAQPLATENVYYCRYGRCHYRYYGYRYYPRYYPRYYGYRHYYYNPGLSFRLF